MYIFRTALNYVISLMKKIETGADYIESLRGRGLKVHLFGELVDEPVDLEKKKSYAKRLAGIDPKESKS